MKTNLLFSFLFFSYVRSFVYFMEHNILNRLAASRIERRAGNESTAQNLLSKGLQECPNSGMLWAEVINTERKAQKRARSVDALKHCDNDPHVIVAVAK